MAIGKQLSDMNPDGTALGQSATDLIGFYGKAPVAQRANSVQASSAISVTSNATACLQEIAATLTGLGLWKGGA